jgi:hypothetical protein
MDDAVAKQLAKLNSLSKQDKDRLWSAVRAKYGAEMGRFVQEVQGSLDKLERQAVVREQLVAAGLLPGRGPMVHLPLSDFPMKYYCLLFKRKPAEGKTIQHQNLKGILGTSGETLVWKHNNNEKKLLDPRLDQDRWAITFKRRMHVIYWEARPVDRRASLSSLDWRTEKMWFMIENMAPRGEGTNW